MTIQEMQEKRIKLEADIVNLLRGFQQETGLSINYLHAETITDAVGREIVVNVKIDVKL